MAQSGYTPILIYASGTTGNTPSAANLTSSASGAELALNYYDGKLFYKDNTGTVQVPSGTLGISGNGTDSGSYQVSSGAGLNFTGGTRTLSSTSSVSGTGTLSVSGATDTALLPGAGFMASSARWRKVRAPWNNGDG